MGFAFNLGGSVLDIVKVGRVNKKNILCNNGGVNVIIILKDSGCEKGCIV